MNARLCFQLLFSVVVVVVVVVLVVTSNITVVVVFFIVVIVTVLGGGITSVDVLDILVVVQNVVSNLKLIADSNNTSIVNLGGKGMVGNQQGGWECMSQALNLKSPVLDFKT